MTEQERQLLSVRAIRVSFASAIRHVPPDQASNRVQRAHQLLAHIRAEAADPSVVAEVAALQEELDRMRPASAQRQN